jgi:hypothetical protein
VAFPDVREKMNNNILITTGIAFIALLVGIGSGFYGALHKMTPALYFHVHDHVWKFEEIADDAYASGDHSIAVWVIGRYIGILEEQEEADYESEWLTRRDLNYSLMIQHSRLAEIHREVNPERFEVSIQSALKNASVIFEEPMTEGELMQLLRDRDLL